MGIYYGINGRLSDFYNYIYFTLLVRVGLMFYVGNPNVTTFCRLHVSPWQQCVHYGAGL